VTKQSFDTPGAVQVRVENRVGAVRVFTHPGPLTEVEVAPTGAAADELVGRTRVAHRDLGGHHVVEVEVPGWGGLWRSVLRGPAEVQVTVRAPEGASLDVTTASGSVSAEGSLGSTRVVTASGSVTVGPVASDLDARSASGSVTVASVTGQADIATSSGSVHCGTLAGEASVKTASGSVAVQAARRRLTVQTASGDVLAGELGDGCNIQTVSGDQRVERLVAGRARFKTVSGDLTLRVARGSGVGVDAESVSGSLSSEIDLSSHEAAMGPAEDGSPHVDLRARTVSGNVRIERAQA
jgi:DUF4097 and DUF4098 domain-containing protein YvlB